MRIGLFTDTYPPYINGVSTSVFMLKKALEKKGHQVFIVTVNNESLKYKFDENNTVIRIPGIPIGLYDYRLTGIYPIRAMNIIRKWKLDVIHSHTEFGIGTFARLISKQYNIPLVHTYHTMYEDYIHYITKGYFDRSSKKVVEYLSLFYCDTTANELIVPTKKTYNLFKEKYNCEKNIYIIPTGIEIERFYEENVDKEKIKFLKKELSLSNDDFVILFVGRIASEKNIEFLIEGQKEIVKKNKNSKLIIIGDGPDIDKYKDDVTKLKIENNVIFTGKVPWEQIPCYYHLANAFVTASTTETQGLTVIEAMSAGIPPVCIDDESFRNVVIDDLNGKLFHNKKEYIEDIISLIKDPVKLSKFSKQARLNSEVYSSKYYAESVLTVYEHAIGDRKRLFEPIRKIIDKMKGKKE